METTLKITVEQDGKPILGEGLEFNGQDHNLKKMVSYLREQVEKILLGKIKL